MIKLTEVQSMHEQREQFGNPDVVIKKGVWLEIIKFDYHTEQADILKRYEVKKIKEVKNKDIINYTITCQKLDHITDKNKKTLLANLILKKFNTKLKASFAKCLIEGIEFRTIPELRGMMY